MKRTTIALLTTLVITNGVGISAAMAAPGDDQGRPVPHDQNGHQGQGPQRQDQGPQHPGGENRPQQMGGRDHGHGQPHRQQASRFAFHGNDFRRGHAAPESFRGDRYRVNDWRARGLSQPPQGHYWANINGNYVLMAAATGIITSIILNGALSH